MRGNSNRVMSTRTTIHALIGEPMPDVEVRTEDLYGAETVFLSVGTRYATSAAEHTVMVAFSGSKASVLRLLEECRQAVIKAGEPQ